MIHRKNWKEAPSIASVNYNFKWVETSTGLEFHSLNKSTTNKQVALFNNRWLTISNSTHIYRTNSIFS